MVCRVKSISGTGFFWATARTAFWMYVSLFIGVSDSADSMTATWGPASDGEGLKGKRGASPGRWRCVVVLFADDGSCQECGRLDSEYDVSQLAWFELREGALERAESK